MVQLLDDKLKTDARKDSAVELNLLTESKLESQTEACAQEQRKNAEETSDSNKREIHAVERDMPLTDDVRCGFWFFKGAFFQRWATEKRIFEYW